MYNAWTPYSQAPAQRSQGGPSRPAYRDGPSQPNPPTYPTDSHTMVPIESIPPHQGYAKGSQTQEYRPRRNDRRDDSQRPERLFQRDVYCPNCTNEGHGAMRCEQPKCSPRQRQINLATIRKKVDSMRSAMAASRPPERTHQQSYNSSYSRDYNPSRNSACNPSQRYSYNASYNPPSHNPSHNPSYNPPTVAPPVTASASNFDYHHGIRDRWGKPIVTVRDLLEAWDDILPLSDDDTGEDALPRLTVDMADAVDTISSDDTIDTVDNDSSAADSGAESMASFYNNTIEPPSTADAAGALPPQTDTLFAPGTPRRQSGKNLRPRMLPRVLPVTLPPAPPMVSASDCTTESIASKSSGRSRRLVCKSPSVEDIIESAGTMMSGGWLGDANVAVISRDLGPVALPGASAPYLEKTADAENTADTSDVASVTSSDDTLKTVDDDSSTADNDVENITSSDSIAGANTLFHLTDALFAPGTPRRKFVDAADMTLSGDTADKTLLLETTVHVGLTSVEWAADILSLLADAAGMNSSEGTEAQSVTGEPPGPEEPPSTIEPLGTEDAAAKDAAAADAADRANAMSRNIDITTCFHNMFAPGTSRSQFDPGTGRVDSMTSRCGCEPGVSDDKLASGTSGSGRRIVDKVAARPSGPGGTGRRECEPEFEDDHSGADDTLKPSSTVEPSGTREPSGTEEPPGTEAPSVIAGPSSTVGPLGTAEPSSTVELSSTGEPSGAKEPLGTADEDTADAAAQDVADEDASAEDAAVQVILPKGTADAAATASSKGTANTATAADEAAESATAFYDSAAAAADRATAMGGSTDATKPCHDLFAPGMPRCKYVPGGTSRQFDPGGGETDWREWGLEINNGTAESVGGDAENAVSTSDTADADVASSAANGMADGSSRLTHTLFAPGTPRRQFDTTSTADEASLAGGTEDVILLLKTEADDVDTTLPKGTAGVDTLPPPMNMLFAPGTPRHQFYPGSGGTDRCECGPIANESTADMAGVAVLVATDENAADALDTTDAADIAAPPSTVEPPGTPDAADKSSSDSTADPADENLLLTKRADENELPQPASIADAMSGGIDVTTPFYDSFAPGTPRHQFDPGGAGQRECEPGSNDDKHTSKTSGSGKKTAVEVAGQTFDPGGTGRRVRKPRSEDDKGVADKQSAPGTIRRQFDPGGADQRKCEPEFGDADRRVSGAGGLSVKWTAAEGASKISGPGETKLREHEPTFGDDKRAADKLVTPEMPRHQFDSGRPGGYERGPKFGADGRVSRTGGLERKGWIADRVASKTFDPGGGGATRRESGPGSDDEESAPGKTYYPLTPA
ncbi:hypothetical protein MMC07_001681 [Pseudocyphellaria aurata]|nr:hypothetical protein [Pseudocyphellaria aurata]